MHRGSLQYWQHRRAQRRLPRVRSASRDIKEAVLLNIVAYKAGMAHLGFVDDSDSPSKSMEISTACTVLEIPHIEIYGARFYEKDVNGYKKIAIEMHHKEISKKLKRKSTKQDESSLPALKGKLKDYADITALLVAYPKGMNVEQHHVVKFESAIGGNMDEKFELISSKLGKELKAAEVFKNGEFVDVSSVTKERAGRVQ